MWPILTCIFLTVAGGLAVLAWRQRSDLARLRSRLAAREAEHQALLDQHRSTEKSAAAQRNALFNSLGEGVLLLDDEERIQLVNPALRRLFGLDREIAGNTLVEAFRHPELQALVERARSVGHVTGAELELRGPTPRFFEVSAATIRRPDGRLHGLILVFHDLTRLRQLERTRREFVANVSHELRTPLSLIKGYVETLIDGARDDPAVSLRFLQLIEKHADRLTYLIEDLLTLSQIESGQIVLNRQPTDLREQATRAMDDLAARAAARGVTLANRVPSDIVVAADADRLQQVLFNLVDNAIKYGRPQGQVEVGGRAVDDTTAEVWVRDDGPGIPAESLERIFERFYRVDKGRSREQGGTGLGLAIVKHIVQSHGGQVGVQSEPGQGTTFRFTLPRTHVASAPSREAPSSSSRGADTGECRS